MGSGKSTIGRQLARKLGFSHLDLDDYFEETYKVSIMHFFQKYDEKAFRNIETKMLKHTLDLHNFVVSTGGGTPCFNNNMDLINSAGFSVYIQMHSKSLFTRLKNAKRPRPRTSFLDDSSLMQRISDDLTIREEFYKQARLTIKGESPNIDFLVGEVLKYLNPS